MATQVRCLARFCERGGSGLQVRPVTDPGLGVTPLREMIATVDKLRSRRYIVERDPDWPYSQERLRGSLAPWCTGPKDRPRRRIATTRCRNRDWLRRFPGIPVRGVRGEGLSICGLR